MRLATFRDVEIAMSRVERELGKLSSAPSPQATNTETIIEKSTITEIDSFQAGNSVIHKLIHRYTNEVVAKELSLVTLLYPTITNVVPIGTNLLRFKELFLNNWDLGANIIPTVDNSFTIGNASFKPSSIYTTRLYLYGECYGQKFFSYALSPNLPLKVNGSYEIISQGINLASATEVTGTLPVNRGGTGRNTLTSGYALVGNGTSAVTLVNGKTATISSIVTGITYTTKTINYKDHSSVNQTATLLDSVSIATSTGLTFTTGILTNVV